MAHLDLHGRRTDVIVIGGGQAGLAMSRCLTDRSVDHLVLERGETANTWRTERWDSLRLLTPNWLTRLPNWSYQGNDPDGYMTAAEVVAFLDAYRRSFDAPVQTGTTVERVHRTDDGYVVSTDQGSWRCRSVVVASGAFSNPRVPAIAAEVPGGVEHLTPTAYRNPAQLPDGDVLVVGASASGLQIADELNRSGRQVTLAAGEHVRLPRTYRGMDIHWWMDAIGQLDERYDEVDDIAKARRLPSLQLVGSPERRNLDLNTVAANGVTVVGRLAAVSGHRGLCSGSLANICTLADLKQQRLLDRLDEYATERGLDAELVEPTRPVATTLDVTRIEVDLRPVGSIVWATGVRPAYPWLDPTLLDTKGQIMHDGGVMNAPGMYVLGLPFLRRRKSSFLDGVGADALDLVEHLARHLDTIAAR